MQAIRHCQFFCGFWQGWRVKKKLIIVFAGDLVANERIGIANLIIFVVKRSNMKRTVVFICFISEQKDERFFVHASPYSYCIAPVPPFSPSTSGQTG
jgi:hypothetical protein